MTLHRTVTFHHTLTLHACSDAGPAENVSCSAHEFRCGSGKCIDRDAVCDYQRDCQYGEDEAPRNALCGTINACSRRQVVTIAQSTCVNRLSRCRQIVVFCLR